MAKVVVTRKIPGNGIQMLKDADKNGVKGFLAGRALWQEITILQGGDKDQFLHTTLPERFKTLVEICK